MALDKKEKKILLISHNFSPEPTGIGKYNGEMIEWLVNEGYDCSVITTFPYYPYWKVQAPYKNRWYKKEVSQNEKSRASLTVYRCPSYVPADPTGKKRIIQDLSFWSSMVWMIFKFIVLQKKFDVIITVAPPFHLAFLGLALQKITGGKLVYHIQDLQIEAAQELNILSNKKLFDKIFKIEKYILDRADFVSSISEGMIAKIKLKANRDVMFFPNWADTSFFFPLPNQKIIKTKWGYDINDTVYLYSGAIGEKQGLESIVNVAEKLKEQTTIKFIICGSGPYKQKLIDLSESKKLSNINFLPVQDKEVFNEFLNMADVHLILQKSDASDLVMPSKLTNILAVGGLALVTAPVNTSLYKTIYQYDMGVIAVPEDDEKLCEAISDLGTKDNSSKTANARAYAEKYLEKGNILRAFIENVGIR